MAGYSPLKITGMETGLVQDREEFLLPNDAYPTLKNAYLYMERIKRKKGFQLLGRLQRTLTAVVLTQTGTGTVTVLLDLFADASINLRASEPNAQIVPRTLVVTLGTATYTDLTGDGSLTVGGVGGTFGIVNYSSGLIGLTSSVDFTGQAITVTVSYFPSLPVMGIRIFEKQSPTRDQTIFFDQKYTYVFNAGAGNFQEFITGTTWNAAGTTFIGTDFFWSTNYYVSSAPIFTTNNVKLFWETNGSGHSLANADPPRITDGTTWVNFFPSAWSQLDAVNFLTNFLCMLPFRGRMVTFNTWEGASSAASVNYSNRIRWSTIGNPFIAYAAGPPATGSWRDDIRGQGGFLDIPTSEDIISVGFVRDNLVIYCESSTWQLRYTGRSIAPFQIEKVNSELGTESTFSTIQFDTSLVGIGDKGIVECDSYQSERIDIKIPLFVFKFNISNAGVKRIQGIRDFQNRLAFWTIPYASAYDAQFTGASRVFPNQRLVFNYENESWALFDDSFTAFGSYYTQSGRTWLNTKLPWVRCNFPWVSQPAGVPIIVAGNQQGFIEKLTETTSNDSSLCITDIVGQVNTATVITSPNHNLRTGQVIKILGIPTGRSYDNLNNGVFSVVLGDETNANFNNKFRLMVYNPLTGEFSTPQLDPLGVYAGVGYITIRDNFSIKSKKFNFMDEGKSIQLGYIDVLLEATEPDNAGAITLKVYLDYDDVNPSNTLPMNQINNGNVPVVSDTSFNSTIPTTPSGLAAARAGTKFLHRAFCPATANFLSLEYTFSNEQMSDIQQEQDVQIDAQVLWVRPAGRMTSV